jgi:hypothetical protein
MYDAINPCPVDGVRSISVAGIDMSLRLNEFSIDLPCPLDPTSATDLGIRFMENADQDEGQERQPVPAHGVRRLRDVLEAVGLAPEVHLQVHVLEVCLRHPRRSRLRQRRTGLVGVLPSLPHAGEELPALVRLVGRHPTGCGPQRVQHGFLVKRPCVAEPDEQRQQVEDRFVPAGELVPVVDVLHLITGLDQDLCGPLPVLVRDLQRPAAGRTGGRGARTLPRGCGTL